MPDPSDLLPGVGDALKTHLRHSDEPLDLAFVMVMVMNLAVWAFLVMLPFSLIGGEVLVFHGTVDIDTTLDYLFPVFLVCVMLPIVYFSSRFIINRHWRKLAEKGREVLWHMDFHGTHGEHEVIFVVGKDAKDRLPEIRRYFEARGETPEEKPLDTE